MTRLLAVLLAGCFVVGSAVSCAKKTPEQKLRDAVAALQKRDPFGAIMLANEVLRENTTGPVALQARALLVQCHMASNDIRACRLVLNDIMDQVGLETPEGQAAAYQKIRTYEIVRQTTEALAQTQSFLQTVTSGTTFWADLMLKRGDLLRATDQLTTAQKVYAEVFRDNRISESDRLDSLNRLGSCYATTQSAPAGIQILEQYLADKPSTETVPHVHMMVGYLHSVLKQTDLSKAEYNKAFEVFERLYQTASGADEKIGVLISYAAAHKFAGEVDQAATLLREGLQKFPTSSKRIDLYYNLAILFRNSDKYDEAIAICREIPSQFPNDPRRVDSYFVAADCRRRQKKYDAAGADYREIIALFPGTNYARYAMIEIRRTEDLKRREAETSATLAAAAAATSPTLSLTTGTAVRAPSSATTQPVPPLPLPPAKVRPSTSPQTRAPVPQTTGSAATKPPVQ